MTTYPTEFELEIEMHPEQRWGNGPWVQLDWDAREQALLVCRNRESVADEDRVPLRPDESDWDLLWRVFDDIRVWDWGWPPTRHVGYHSVWCEDVKLRCSINDQKVAFQFWHEFEPGFALFLQTINWLVGDALFADTRLSDCSRTCTRDTLEQQASLIRSLLESL